MANSCFFIGILESNYITIFLSKIHFEICTMKKAVQKLKLEEKEQITVFFRKNIFLLQL